MVGGAAWQGRARLALPLGKAPLQQGGAFTRFVHVALVGAVGVVCIIAGCGTPFFQLSLKARPQGWPPCMQGWRAPTQMSSSHQPLRSLSHQSVQCSVNRGRLVKALMRAGVSSACRRRHSG